MRIMSRIRAIGRRFGMRAIAGMSLRDCGGAAFHQGRDNPAKVSKVMGRDN
jgi:hypothetical protein